MNHENQNPKKFHNVKNGSFIMELIWYGIFPEEDSSLDESGFFNSYSQQVIGNDAPDNTENANIVYKCVQHTCIHKL